MPLTNDVLAENTESFVLRLYGAKDTSGTAVAIANNYATAIIVDNDTPVTDVNANGSIDNSEKAALSVRDVVVDEKTGVATFDLILSKAVSTGFSVAYSTTDASASASSDYTATSGSVTFAAGQTSQRVSINLLDDALAEGTEYFHLSLGAITGTTDVLVADGVGTAFIGSNDQPAVALPTISSGDIVVSEADGYAEFVVRLSAPGTSTITVVYETRDRTADDYSDNDYSSTYGTLSFAPGVTTQTVRVPLTSDATAENIESFVLILHSAKDASGTAVAIANNYATATIVDNDTPVTDVNANGSIDNSEKAALSVRDVVVDEKTGVATFDLILSKAVSTGFSVAYSTTDASASASSDYTATSGSVTFAAGQTSQRVSINLLDDALAEGTEYFHLSLGAITGTTDVLVADGVGTAFIGSNDQSAVALPTISSGDIVVSETDGYAEFVVRLSAPGTSTITISYQTASKTAEYYSDRDFSSTSGTLSFAPGVTTQTVRVPLTNDVIAEGFESFELRLSNAKNAAGVAVPVANSVLTATIVDDDNGFELLNYGLGDDFYTITHSNQYIVETPDGGIDWVQSSINYSLADTDGSGMFGSFVENLALTDSAISGTGNAMANILVGNASNNQLHGMEGNDWLAGGSGNDILNGGSGIDTAFYLGNAAQYGIRADRAAGTASVSDTLLQRDGTDALNGIERVAFADLTLNLTVGGVASTIPQASLNRIAELYVAFFNRIPDGDGMQFWIETFKSGQSINQIAEAFYNAGVYFSDITGYRADMTNDDFIHIVYRNVLGRSEGADAGGLSFWRAELASGRSSKGALVSSILDAAHGETFSDPNNPYHWVQKLLDNKLQVARQVSVEWGVNYNSSEDSISKGMGIAAAITPDDTSAAISLVGVADFGLI